MSTREIENIKQRFIEHPDPLRIYLFGSSANGTDTAANDLDFYIVVRDGASDPADNRDVAAVAAAIEAHGFQPVYKDWDRI